MKLTQLQEARSFNQQTMPLELLSKKLSKVFPEGGAIGGSLEGRLYDHFQRRTCPDSLEKYLQTGDEYCWQQGAYYTKRQAKNKNEAINLAYRDLAKHNLPRPEAADAWLMNNPGEWDHNKWYVRLFYVRDEE